MPLRAPPPPPPMPLPPLPPTGATATPRSMPEAPELGNAPSGAFLLELLIYNGHPFKDHWAYSVRTPENPAAVVKMHATGNVREGFKFEVKRSCDLESSDERPTARIPLQWIDSNLIDDEAAMFNSGVYKVDDAPRCRFEKSLYKTQVPGKTLNDASNNARSGKKIIERDCQTWIVESAAGLAREGIMNVQVADYLRAMAQ
ncbi:DUF6540 domain-containing protein [Microdochium nivale]|nr:DUF6540 domain-containing protein [Microdochium nivale]